MMNQERVQLVSSVAEPPAATLERPAGTPGYAWVVLTILFFAEVLVGYVFFAVPPLMPILIDRFRIHMGSAGLMMSIFGMVGLVISLPVGHLMKKHGIRAMGIAASVCLCAGCLLGARATSYPVFLVSRALVAAGFTQFMLLGTTAVGIWFAKEDHGLGMGLVSTCTGFGGFLAMASASRIHNAFGLQAVWWSAAAAAFVVLVVVAIGVKMPPWMSAAKMAAQKRMAVSEGFANRNMWLLAVAFSCVYLCTMALMTFYIHYLSKVRGFTLQHAGFLNSLGWLGMILGAVLGGYLIGKMGHLQLTLTVGILVLAVLVLLPFKMTGIMIPTWVILMDAVGMGYCKVACMTAIPGIMAKPHLVGVGMSIYGFGVSVGGMIGPPCFGAIAQRFGWDVATYVLVPVLLIGVLAVRMTRFTK
jgi:predicted MFS family arabinose efflux permease